MAIQTTDKLKGWFVTLAKPLQDQFWDWIDSFRHKNEKITINDLDNDLQTALQGIGAVNVFRPQDITLVANGSFMMLTKYRLENLAMKNNSGAAMDLKVGTTPGGYEISEGPADGSLEPGATWDLDLGKTFWADTLIYISGVTGELNVLIDRK